MNIPKTVIATALSILCVATSALYADPNPEIPIRTVELDYPDRPDPAWNEVQKNCYERVLRIEQQRLIIKERVEEANAASYRQSASKTALREYGEAQSGRAGAMGMRPGSFSTSASSNGNGVQKSDNDPRANLAKQKAALDQEYQSALAEFRIKTSWRDPLARQINDWRNHAARSKRTWTDRMGRTVEATLVSFDGSTVSLVTQDGKSHSFPVQGFTQEDQAYLKNLPTKLKR